MDKHDIPTNKKTRYLDVLRDMPVKSSSMPAINQIWTRPHLYIHNNTDIEASQQLIFSCSVENETQKADRKKDACQKFLLSGILLICTFLAHFLSVGLSFSLGVYFVEFLQVFQRSSGLTSWIGSLNFAALCSAGPFASKLITKIGCRSTILIGGLMSTIGIFTSAFSQNIYMVFAFFGVVTGAGYGLVFTASLSAINLNFNQWRVFAMGFSLCGVGLGTFAHPFLANVLISHYGWRGSLLITSGMNTHICLLGMVVGLVSQNEDCQNHAKLNTTAKKNRPIVIKNCNKDIRLEYFEQKGTLINNNNNNAKVLHYIEPTSEFEHKSIWKMPKYWALHINCLLFCFGQSVIYTHIASFASSCGFNPTQCSSFISIVGIWNLIGRVGLGLVAQHPNLNDHVNSLFNGCYVTAGVWTILYSVWQVYSVMAVLMALLGFSIAAFGPLLSEVVCRTVGVNKFAEGYGFLMLSMAMGTLLGAPSAGWLYDVTNKYKNSFYLGGFSFILSSLIMLLPKLSDKIEELKGKTNYLSPDLMNSKLQHSLRNIPLYSSHPIILESVIKRENTKDSI